MVTFNDIKNEVLAYFANCGFSQDDALMGWDVDSVARTIYENGYKTIDDVPEQVFSDMLLAADYGRL